MATTQPIREKKELKKFMNYYRNEQPNPRNQALIVLGLHTALRISDILSLQWQDVFDFKKKKYHSHIYIHEKKTGKFNAVALNLNAQQTLDQLRKMHKNTSPEDYIFSKTTSALTPLSRSQAFRIIKTAARNTNCNEHISCHSLRKTFGYYAWKEGTPPALLMNIYNHSSYEVTKKYLGIEQDERDKVFLNLEFFE